MKSMSDGHYFNGFTKINSYLSAFQHEEILSLYRYRLVGC